VVAGTGKRGFAGDGGLAVDAELASPAGMAVARDGTLYVADQGNNRVRAVSPAGMIRTVAGNGRSGWVPSGTLALAASVGSPNAVAIGPDGHLYVSAGAWGEVLRLERGRLRRIAGIRGPEGVVGTGRPATHASVDGADGLAFDRAGNLYLAGFNTKTLLMVTPAGTMTLPAGTDGFYPGGNGGLATTADGSVLAMETQRIVRLTPHGIRTVFDFGHRRFEGISGFLPNGIAVARDGTIFVDTALGNGWTSTTALVAVSPGRRLRVLWKS
jgi:sugar lactone lactonase YvrE